MSLRIGPTLSNILVVVYLLGTLFFRFQLEAAAGSHPCLDCLACAKKFNAPTLRAKS